MNTRRLHIVRRTILASAIVLLALQTGRGATNQILGWNNLGMHCMDSDYSVFSILPPYNTIEAQLIVNGRLVTNGTGYSVIYQAVADPSGSINKSSIGKGNWLQYAPQLFGAVAGDQGLPFPNTNIFWMPGAGNTPQAMIFEQTNEPAGGVFTPVNWFHAYGVPITPYDDAGRKNPYPMMRQIALSGATPIATNDVVLPVSDEMDCRACHASGSQDTAKPAAGWVWDGIQERDFRLNILRLHDEKNFVSNAVVYAAALAAKGFNPQGLYRGVVANNKPVLCAACHASEALGGGGIAGIPPLTTSVHGFHAHVMDPLSNIALNNTANRSACYRCHPGSTTRCLRGAMGGAIAADGSMEMQCQSCHGSMNTVGSPSRVGWFMEPNCASCHTGTATNNSGQIRYTSVFTDTNYTTVRTPANWIFSTQTNVPATNLWLYRFSKDHGGLQCAACHGSTHAEFPSIHANDNVRNQEIQGHAGVMVECTSCHVATPAAALGGPHGMHAVGTSWVNSHHQLMESNLVTKAQCQPCHGADYHGTVLSRMQMDRTFSAFGTITYFRGAIIGCYTCHNGPDDDSGNPNAAPTVTTVSGSTSNNVPLNLLVGVTPTTATLRIISQPTNGAVGVSGNVLTYFPNPGFTGSDAFTYAAWDTSKNSLLVTGTVAVVQGPYSLGVAAHVPTNYPVRWPVAFAVVPTVTNYSGPVTFNWNFGDGSAVNTNQFPAHAYNSTGTYGWSVTATASNATASASGSIAIAAPMALSMTTSSQQFKLAWPGNVGNVILEQSASLDASVLWTAVTNTPGGNGNQVDVPVSGAGMEFFRLHLVW